MQLVALRKGGGPCYKDCPFYTETGVVHGINGPLATHCRSTMETVMVDCDIWDTHNIEKLEVTESEWEAMQQAIHKRAKKVCKEYPTDHAEIHPVGWHWSHDKWNSKKSLKVKKQ